MANTTLSPITPKTADAESTMNRNLGLYGSPPSSPNDPLKMARQAIRSQVTAREYAEQQLVKAQSTIQDLRTRLRHVHQEREAAVKAAQSAVAAKDSAERSARAAESALANERAARARTEGRLRDAEATVQDLREKLAMANQAIKSTQAEFGAERLARSPVDDGVIAVPETVVAAVQDGADPTVRRPRGRPRKVVVMETVQTMITPSQTPLAIRDDAVLPSVEAVGPTIRRPVGRPRKVVLVEPISIFATPPKKASVSAKAVAKKAAKPKQMISRREADDGEPVQWWVEGWKRR